MICLRRRSFMRIVLIESLGVFVLGFLCLFVFCGICVPSLRGNLCGVSILYCVLLLATFLIGSLLQERGLIFFVCGQSFVILMCWLAFFGTVCFVIVENWVLMNALYCPRLSCSSEIDFSIQMATRFPRFLT